MPTISLVIATFNRAAALDQCLRELSRQAFTPGDEVIVANNGSTDETSRILAAAAERFPVPLRTLFVSTPGKSYAVEAALAVATGDIVALTDDDVLVPPDWTGCIREAFQDPDVALAGGPVEPHWESAPPRWLSVSARRRLGAPLGLLDYGAEPQRLGDRTLLGANLVVRREVLQRHGGYATHLGKMRGTLLSGEDHELCQRIQAAGGSAWYLPNVRVQHRVPTSRMRVSYFLRWFFWSGITHAALERMSAATARAPHVPAFALRQFAGGLAAALAWGMRGQLPSAVDRALDSAFAAGYVAARSGLVRTGVAPEADHA